MNRNGGEYQEVPRYDCPGGRDRGSVIKLCKQMQGENIKFASKTPIRKPNEVHFSFQFFLLVFGL